MRGLKYLQIKELGTGDTIFIHVYENEWVGELRIETKIFKTGTNKSPSLSLCPWRSGRYSTTLAVADRTTHTHAVTLCDTSERERERLRLRHSVKPSA